MYTAIYVRVSTGMQAAEGTSLEGQLELCSKKATELGIPRSLIKVYKEEGFTGEDIDRPAMNELRQDVVSGKISRLIITHPDRLTRDLTDKLILCREFEKSDIELNFVDTEYRKTPEGQLFFNLMSSIAQYELSLIKKRTVRGRLKAVEKEHKIMPMRVPPYGYDLIDNSLVINENEAQFVKKIYQWYVHDNHTLREIGEKLYALGAIPKRAENKHWSASSIRRILSSEIYIGKYHYNRRETRKVKGEKTNSGTPKKTYQFRNENEWIEVKVPGIIDKGFFELAQKQKEKNTKKSGNVKYEYLLKSLIRCGHCGRIWQGTTYSGRLNKQTGEKTRYTCYRCPNVAPKKYGDGIEKCPTLTLRAEKLDDYVWKLILESFSNPDDYIERLNGNSKQITDELRMTVMLLEKQLEQKEKEKEKIKIMFKREVIDEEEMIAEIKKINAAYKILKNELSKYHGQISAQKEKQLFATHMKEYSELVNRFVESNGADLNFDVKRQIIEVLIDEIVIKYAEDGVQITAIGALDELKQLQFLQHEDDIGSCSQPQEI